MTEKKIELHIASGRINNKVVLEMSDESAQWLAEELEAPTTEWKIKRGELAALLRRTSCQ